MGLIERALQICGPLDRVHTEPVEMAAPFFEIAGRFADLPGTVVLLSGGDGDAARYHILAVNPWMAVKSYGSALQIECAGKCLSGSGNPFDLIRQLIRAFRIEGAEMPEPVDAGLFGYLAYDLKDVIESLPRTAVDDLGLPQTCLYAPSAILIQDRQTGSARLCIPVRKNRGEEGLDADRKAFLSRFNAPAAPGGSFGRSAAFHSAFTRRTYMAAVEKIKEYIASGHIYQVNLSQRFETRFSGNPYALFRTLFESAPAPFYAYVHAGDHQIVSTSPERFLLQRGRSVETRPIKGTRPRGKTPEEDRELAEALVQSRKDDAELSMIVDLMRNDLGRVCAGGSVKVTAHKRLEPYRNVFHLVSVINGHLSEGADSIDLVRAAFPGGSITGCPRIRAMEIIDELEPCRRHIYTGSIGYIGFHDTMDLSIAIRTATIAQGRMYFSVGGGVVFDSDPEDEFEETLHKGRTVMGAFEQRIDGNAPEKIAWFDGLLVPEADARLPVTDPGVQYGWGIFETLRADRGKPGFLEAHLERFGRSWRRLFDSPEPDLTWPVIIEQVLAANRLENQLARVKILAARGEGGRPRLAVTAAAYVPRLEQLGKSGLELVTYPHPRQTPWADHKTTNYLYYAMANRWAMENGADEAVVLNPDGSLSETATGNLLFLCGRHVVLPESDHVLSGIMQKQVTGWLSSEGYALCRRRIMPQEVATFDGILMTNSLIGAAAVFRVDGVQVPTNPSLCAHLNRALFESDSSALQHFSTMDDHPFE